MDSGSAKRHSTKSKRREKGARVSEEQHNLLEGKPTSSPSPTRPTKGKGKAPRRRKNDDALSQEDVIAGFAFTSFKSREDLEVSRLPFHTAI